MFEFLKGREQKLIEAIQNGDLEKLGPLLNKFDEQTINSPVHEGQTALELAIRASQPKVLALILSKGGDATLADQAGEPLTALALAQTESLALLTALLAAGADSHIKDSQGRSLLQICVDHCDPAQLALHLSRLQQHGADLNSYPQLLVDALLRFDQPLIQFLINSGCELPELPAEVPVEAVSYAKRLIDDYRIQQAFMQR